MIRIVVPRACAAIILWAICLTFGAQRAWAATASGTSITNSMTVNYQDASSNNYSTTSNTVTTLVSGAPSLTVSVASQNVTIGMIAVHTFTLTNTGNGSGNFQMPSDATLSGTATGTTLNGYVLNAASSGTCSVATPCTLSTLETQMAALSATAANGTITVGVEYTVSASATVGQTIIVSLTANINYPVGTVSQALSSNVTGAPTDTVTADARLDVQASATTPTYGGSNITWTVTANDGGGFAAAGLQSVKTLLGSAANGIAIFIPVPSYSGTTLTLQAQPSAPTLNSATSGATAVVYYNATACSSSPTSGWSTTYSASSQCLALLLSGGTGGVELPSAPSQSSGAGNVTTAQVTFSFITNQPSTIAAAAQNANAITLIANSAIGGNTWATGAIPITGQGISVGASQDAATASLLNAIQSNATPSSGTTTPGGASNSAGSNQYNPCAGSHAAGVVCQIAAGSSTSISPFAADGDYSGGGSSADGVTVSTSLVQNPAPTAVYANEHNNVTTYTIPSLTVGNTYTVRLHFSENFFGSTGQRQFNVAVNGTTILSNFDIVAIAGPKSAYIKEYAATADSNGVITIAYTNGSANQPAFQGIEILSSPLSPTGLSVTSNGPGTLYTLTWSASTGATSYKIYRGTSSGGESGTPYQTGISATTYADTVTAGSTYCYQVSAVNANGESARSPEFCETSTGQLYSSYRINANGGAVGSFAADNYYSGGGTSSNGNTINLTGPSCNFAPSSLYGTLRWGSNAYVFPVTASTKYLVRLHFAESYFSSAGQRKFNVLINGTQVLTNFDEFATAGAQSKAIVQEFMTTSTSSGMVNVTFSPGTADQPEVAGLEILPAVAPAVSLSLAVSPTGAQNPGTDLTYTTTFTNASSNSTDAVSFVITKPVPSNTYFKVGSAASSLGSTFLSATLAYSNNSGSTYVYTPASAGGGAPSGYDATVTNVRWTFTGTLCASSSNNSGNASFTARIK